jgi:DNA topoisomerase 2-associated protein PAT1
MPWLVAGGRPRYPSRFHLLQELVGPQDTRLPIIPVSDQLRGHLLFRLYHLGPTLQPTMSSFFGFDTSLPERRSGDGRPGLHQLPRQAQGQRQPQAQAFGGFQASNPDQTFGLPGAGEEEDLAVYTWGEGIGGGLLEGNDEMNDETFGDVGEISEFSFWLFKLFSCCLFTAASRWLLTLPIATDFQYSAQSAPPSKSRTISQPRGPIASTASRFKPKPVADPFAFSEDDFYGSRRGSASQS